MAHGYHPAAFARPALPHQRELRFDGLVAAARLAHHLQMPRVVNVQKRLDLQGRAQHRHRAGNASAVTQMVEGIHREPVAHVQAVFLQPGHHFLKAHALSLLFQRLTEQKAFAHGSAQRIHTHQLAFGVLLGQLPHAQPRALDGAGKAGGKAQVEYVLPIFQGLFKGLAVHQRIDLRGGGELAGALLGVELLHGEVAAGTVGVGTVAHHDLHGDDLRRQQPFAHGRTGVGGGVAVYLIAHAKNSSSSLVGAAKRASLTLYGRRAHLSTATQKKRVFRPSIPRGCPPGRVRSFRSSRRR